MKTILALIFMATLASCSTVEGFGEDITGASRTVQGWL